MKIKKEKPPERKQTNRKTGSSSSTQIVFTNEIKYCGGENRKHNFPELKSRVLRIIGNTGLNQCVEIRRSSRPSLPVWLSYFRHNAELV